MTFDAQMLLDYITSRATKLDLLSPSQPGPDYHMKLLDDDSMRPGSGVRLFVQEKDVFGASEASISSDENSDESRSTDVAMGTAEGVEEAAFRARVPSRFHAETLPNADIAPRVVSWSNPPQDLQ